LISSIIIVSKRPKDSTLGPKTDFLLSRISSISCLLTRSDGTKIRLSGGKKEDENRLFHKGMCSECSDLFIHKSLKRLAIFEKITKNDLYFIVNIYGFEKKRNEKK
jgi:hypothetical protein